MESILQNISEYRLLNNLIPGGFFVGVLSWAAGWASSDVNFIFIIAISYVAGVILSRLGSLIVEPVAKKAFKVEFAPYTDYCQAEKRYPKLTIMNTENNIYRTFVAMGACLLLGAPLIGLLGMGNGNALCALVLMATLFIVVFMIAYIKRTQYIVHRVENELSPAKTKTKKTKK